MLNESLIYNPRDDIPSNQKLAYDKFKGKKKNFDDMQIQQFHTFAIKKMSIILKQLS